MPTTKYFDEVISKLPPGLERKIYGILTQHVGERNAISLRDLAKLAFGTYNSTTERQCREAIEILRRDYHIPVLSHSGKAGRWLAGSIQELQETIAEMETRGRNTLATAQALRQARIPGRDPFAEKAVQEALL